MGIGLGLGLGLGLAVGLRLHAISRMEHAPPRLVELADAPPLLALVRPRQPILEGVGAADGRLCSCGVCAGTRVKGVCAGTTVRGSVARWRAVVQGGARLAPA